jgi:hydrogenase nickel incorporation protein HypA/HybF
MHEYPITCEIIRITEEHAKRYGAKAVSQINLVIGEDSGFIGDSIEMYFEEISKGTLCEGAHISIDYIKPKLECLVCEMLFERSPFSFKCPLCGQLGRITSFGKEFYVKSIEIET